MYCDLKELKHAGGKKKRCEQNHSLFGVQTAHVLPFVGKQATIALSASLCDVTSPLARNKKKKKKATQGVEHTGTHTRTERNGRIPAHKRSRALTFASSTQQTDSNQSPTHPGTTSWFFWNAFFLARAFASNCAPKINWKQGKLSKQPNLQRCCVGLGEGVLRSHHEGLMASDVADSCSPLPSSSGSKGVMDVAFFNLVCCVYMGGDRECVCVCVRVHVCVRVCACVRVKAKSHVQWGFLRDKYPLCVVCAGDSLRSLRWYCQWWWWWW